MPRILLAVSVLVSSLVFASTARALTGEDRLVVAEPQFSSQGQTHSLAVASNGDAYAAVEVVTVDPDADIRIYRSSDGGQTWTLWATLGDADATSQFHHPSLHIAEGSQNRLYIAYLHNVSATQVIEVAYSALGGPSGSFTAVTAMSQAGVGFQYPSLTSDAVSNPAYKLFLVAQGKASDGADIWFARSTTFGASWEAKYAISSVSNSLFDDAYPVVRYGSGGVVHCIWEEDPRTAAGDDGVFTRRALNFAAGGLADWQSTITLGSTSNDTHELDVSIAASRSSNKVIASYLRIALPSRSVPPLVRLSNDGGVTWAAADTFPFPGATVAVRLLALPGGLGFRASYQRFQSHFLTASTDATPIPLLDQGEISDHPYDSPASEAADIAYDPTRANTVAALWNLLHVGSGLDSLIFDSAERTGVGVEEGVLPTSLRLFAPVPDPARGPVTFRFDQPAPGAVRLRLTDARGRTVRTLLLAGSTAGRHQLTWDGNDATGMGVHPGVFFAQLETDGVRGSVSRRFVVVR